MTYIRLECNVSPVKFFPQPHLRCVLGEIGPNIKEEIPPVPVNKIKKLISKIEKDTPLPNLYRRLLK